MSNIVLVEDDMVVSSVLERMLSKDGHHIITTDSGLEALKLLDVEPLDIMITDIMMPKYNGLRLAKEVRKHHPELPIIAISGGGEYTYMLDVNGEGFKESKVDVFFMKPLNFASLKSSIRDLVNQHNQPAQ